MYYLLNQTNQIIAADAHLLTLCGVSHIDELSSQIIRGDTVFDLTEEKLIINNDISYVIAKTSLSSMLGDLTLVTLKLEDTAEESTELADISEENFLHDISLDDGAEEEQEEEEKEIASIDLDSELAFIKPDEETKADDDFLMPDTELPSTPEDTEEILIDIETISQNMGISKEDYNTFVDEYIDTALGLESDLQSDNDENRNNAIATLSHLGDVLRLPIIDGIIEKLSHAPKESQKELITSFYATLSRLTTIASETSEKVEPEVKEEETHFELFDMPSEEPVVEVEQEVKKKANANANSFGTISLEGIKPIHFDFQLEEAANDLSLPVELIEEFVNDFIEQGHIETKKMLEAYEEGDLDAIQKIGHLLKGASSNLRINALSDTLYKIQFCEDPSELEAFIKEYWGHFLSFEIQINALAK